jgi:hypothetical protein
MLPPLQQRLYVGFDVCLSLRRRSSYQKKAPQWAQLCCGPPRFSGVKIVPGRSKILYGGHVEMRSDNRHISRGISKAYVDGAGFDLVYDYEIQRARQMYFVPWLSLMQ